MAKIMVDEKKLELKKQMKKKKPSFNRQEGYRHSRLKDAWRKPAGKHSKQRMHEKARGVLPNPGYGTPAELRGLNKDGFEEVLVNNEKDVAALDPKTQVAVVASGVGAKKKETIVAKANELKIRITNIKSC